MQKCVLIVDDNRLIRDMLSRFFEMTEYAHESARNAEEALEMIERKHYDVVLSDFDMQGMNGGELAKIVRAKRPGTIIVLMSGRSSPRMLTSADADVCMQKPFSLEGLMEALRRTEEAKGKARKIDDSDGT